MARTFKYNGQSYQDPGAEYSVDEVKKHLAAIFPEVAQATVETKTLEDGTEEVTFVKRAGTKGMIVGITIKLERASELQVLNEALSLYADHLAQGEIVPIIGRNTMHALDLVRTLQEEIGLKPRREAGEYTPVRQADMFGEGEG